MDERHRRWLAENAGAIEANNAWVEEHGLPLGRHRIAWPHEPGSFTPDAGGEEGR